MAGGIWVSQSAEHLPLAQVMVLGSWDQAPCRAPCSAGSLLLPLSFSLKQINYLMRQRERERRRMGDSEWAGH